MDKKVEKLCKLSKKIMAILFLFKAKIKLIINCLKSRTYFNIRIAFTKIIINYLFIRLKK